MNDKKPNVIVFFTDQQRWDTTGVHGNPLGLTPNFDWMAMNGTHLYHSFTNQPVCGPARACLQTGMYGTSTGCFRNNIPLPDTVPTLAESFNRHGYDTAYIGKWHLAATKTEPVPVERRGGYREWLAADALELMSDAYHTVVYNKENEQVKLPGYRVDALTDAAIRYIDQRDPEKPFFLFLSLLEPHQQNYNDDYSAPAIYKDSYHSAWVPPDLAALGGNAHQKLGGYYGMVKRIDEALGRLLDTLRSLDLIDETIVLFTSDHACHFNTRSNEYKRSCHESSIRVPTAIIGPGFEGGGRRRELTGIVDLPPTLLEAAGIERPEAMEGRSLMPLLNRQQTEWRDELFVQISESQVGRALRTPKWKYAVHAPGVHPREESGSQHYVEQFLYDLEADPYELMNLAGVPAFSDIAEQLRTRLAERIREVEGIDCTIAPAEEKILHLRKPGL
ncbi:sulfatase-like hydrolase/transferase [Paenibacillus sp. 1P07SE]|uniref:sulfatase-like hydrolase/transferase n=1 Tax=Paenibacillus sp. 1P07SE TaxID=3132209 RepID=UPI0039A77EE6